MTTARFVAELKTALPPDVVVVGEVNTIVKDNLDRYREFFGVEGERACPHLDLTNPEIDYARLAQGFGVPARRVEEPARVGPAIREGFASGGPYLLDVRVDAH